MAEREIYNPATGEYELIDDDGIYETNPFGQNTAPAPAAPTRRGPPYTTANPPPEPKPGYQWILNPATGQFEERLNGPAVNNPVTTNTDAVTTNTVPYSSGQTSQGGGADAFSSLGGPPAMRSLDSLWPDWAPPQFAQPPAFSYGDFVAPTLAEAENEPGYAFSATQGRKQVEASKAAQGVYRSGQTLKDIYSWASEYAKQNYGGAFDRKLTTYGTNRDNAAENYRTNYGVSRDVFDRGYNSYQGGFDSRRRKAELDFGRDWDMYEADRDTKKFLVNAGND